MHELSIAMSLVELASERARRAGAARVTRLKLRIGALRGIEGESMRQAFEAARIDSPCGDAELRIENVPLRARCRDCGAQYEIEGAEWACPACGSDGELLDGGDELQLASIEVEAKP